jgi:hypothetical protein
MALPAHINDREQAKFVELDGEVAVRTTASGEFSTSGLKTGGKITEVTVNDSTWTALPPTPLTGRNALAIQNQSGIEIKVNYLNTEPGYVGMVVADGIERFYDIKDTILIYGKSSGGDAILNIEELA